MTDTAALTRMLETSARNWGQQMQMNELDIAVRAVKLFAETHPRPTHVTMTQAGEMLGLTRLSRKVDVMTLAKISGHTDLRILQEVYYREAAEDIAARL